MATTRINHRGCIHERTPAARAACRRQQQGWLDAMNGTTRDAEIEAAFGTFYPEGEGCMYHRDHPERCDRVGAYEVSGDVWCATAMDEHRQAMIGCRRCGNPLLGFDVTGPNTEGACGPTYCHYAVSN